MRRKDDVTISRIPHCGNYPSFTYVLDNGPDTDLRVSLILFIVLSNDKRSLSELAGAPFGDLIDGLRRGGEVAPPFPSFLSPPSKDLRPSSILRVGVEGINILPTSFPLSPLTYWFFSSPIDDLKEARSIFCAIMMVSE